MKYVINLMVANPTFKGSLREYETDIDKSIIYFNAKSESKNNRKSIKKIEIQDTVLILELQTETEMPAPAKALRTFTKHLLDNSKLGEQAYYGSLFRSVKIASPSNVQIDTAQPAELIIMNKLLRLLVGEDMNKDEYFSILETLLKCTNDMENACLKSYSSRICKIMIEEAQKLGH